MDINNIFGLFSSGSKEEEIYENLDTFKKTPLFKLSMFVKLILNGINFKKKLLYFFQKSSEDLGLDDVDLAGEFVVYNRGWYWINQVNLEDDEWQEDILKMELDDLLVSLQLSINYFEECEEYEKCAFLKKIEDFVQKNLDSIE
jgi:hypothetical protein